MRNRYAGTCYRCNQRVEPGDGHFERFKGSWRTQHATCAIAYRGRKVFWKCERPRDLSHAEQIAAQGAQP